MHMDMEYLFEQIQNKMKKGFCFETYYCDFHRKTYLVICEQVVGTPEKNNCNFIEGSCLMDCYRKYLIKESKTNDN